jgi:hypothetical protein
MLKGKKTVNLKDLKESQEARMEKSITEIKTLNITDCGIKQINNTPLNMKRKRDTKQKDYGNNARKRIATSEDHASKVCFSKFQQIFLIMNIEFQNCNYNHKDFNVTL